MKVVINRCYGGFGVSDEGCRRLIELGMKVTDYDEKGQMIDKDAQITKTKPAYPGDSLYYYSHYNSDRGDPRLVQMVEELGDKASGKYSELKVVEIPDGVEYEVEEYDGLEWIAEKHRTWE